MKNNETNQIENWSNQWSQFSDYIPQYSEQLKRWLSLKEPEKFFPEKRVLDAGCGNGRNSVSVIGWGAKEVVSFDVLDKTVAVAKRNLAGFKNSTVLQSSIYDIPDEIGQFDVVMCIGVVHHLDSQEEALRQLLKRVAPDGSLIFWVYGNQSSAVPLITFTRNLFKTPRLPFRFLLGLSRILALILKGFLSVIRPKGDYWVLLRGFSITHLAEIIVDQLHPRIAHYFSESELEKLVRSATDLPFAIQEVNGISWSVAIENSDSEI